MGIRTALVLLLATPCACGGAPQGGLGGLIGDAEPAPTATADASAPGPTDEPAKIQQLIALVRSSNLVFIRNGKEYSPADAAEHLASKAESAADPKMTAREFIQKHASFSSQSGEPYVVRLPDGKTMPASDWLLARLAEIEAGPRGGRH